MKNGGKNKSVAFIILFSVYVYIYIYIFKQDIVNIQKTFIKFLITRWEH